MDELVVGSSEGLRFVLAWETPEAAQSPVDATRGRLQAWVGERLVWGAGDPGAPLQGVSWVWIELLEHLATSWPYLQWEEVDPLRLQVDPGVLWAVAQRRWEGLSRSGCVEEEAELWAFLNAHDLARGLQGAWPAPLWVLREGEDMQIGTTDHRIRRRANETLGTLSGLGDVIAARLRGLRDARAAAALAAWQGRERCQVEDFMAAVAGMPVEYLKQVSGDQELAGSFEVDPDSPEPTELLAAARMIGRSLEPVEIRRLTKEIRAFRHRPTESLDELSSRAQEFLAQQTPSSPHEQGYALAMWLRRQPGILDAQGRTEPDRLLRRWGVSVRKIHLSAPGLAAVTCWGPKHGPGILVNWGGAHAKTDHARRASLAHEICHLLVDRQGALPLAEVLGGSAPPAVEARAGTFAAELLLPRRVAAQAFLSGSTRTRLRFLQNRYGVSQELVAWQVHNSGVEVPAGVLGFLRTLVSKPECFRWQPLSCSLPRTVAMDS